MATRADERTRLRVAQGWTGPSPKRFDGWEPEWETTYEYDEDDRLVRSVTRMVEPEWDDATRFRALGLRQYDDDCCPGCGLHQSILDDPDGNVFTFEERTCRVCAAQDVFGRVVADAHEKAKKQMGENPSPRAARPDDGHRIYIRRATRDEVAARRSRD